MFYFSSLKTDRRAADDRQVIECARGQCSQCVSAVAKCNCDTEGLTSCHVFIGEINRRVDQSVDNLTINQFCRNRTKILDTLYKNIDDPCADIQNGRSAISIKSQLISAKVPIASN